MKNILKGCALAWGFLVVSYPASADPEDSWNIIVGTSLTNDNNLFRETSGQEHSDQITGAFVGLKVNKAYSLQNFNVDALITDSKFSNNGNLDNIGKVLNAAWLWSLTPKIHGNLSTNYSQGLSSFSDYKPLTNTIQTGRNIRTSNSERFDSEWEAWGRIRLIGGVNRYELKNSASVFQQDNFTATSVEYGIKYIMPSGSQFTLLGRSANGEYTNRILNSVSALDTGYSQQDTEFRFVWLPSEKSHFTGRLAYINREHDHFASRNYDGTVGSLEYSLDVTGKLKVIVGVVRDLASYQDNFSSYNRINAYSISSAWQITAKTSMHARYNHEKHTYLGQAPINTVLPSYGGYIDTLRQSSLGLDWQALRTLTLSASAQRENRDSTFQFAKRDFSSNMLYFSANLAF
jgi:exopolysaccharide biosynthesis operon protein EpsL